MDYSEQQRFLMTSRGWGLSLLALLVAAAVIALQAVGSVTLSKGSATTIFLVLTALAISLCYTPDYLHLTVDLQKNRRWAVRVRWRMLAAISVIGVFCVSSAAQTTQLLIAVTWLLTSNLIARRFVPATYVAFFFWVTDVLLVRTLLIASHFNLLVVAVFLAAAAHFSIVICRKYVLAWAGTVLLSAAPVLWFAGWLRHDRPFLAVAPADLWVGSMALLSTLGTGFMVYRVQQHNASNVDSALRELIDFTGYPAAEVRRLWSSSNHALARNWKEAALPEKDRERLAEWYRANSELYLFAISAYNLEYKRIRSNIKVLKYAQGRCLDYGAGNGELLLELARRGHRVTYYDVEGETMKFAQWRMKRRGLAMDFAHSKEELAQSVPPGTIAQGFDTVFAFDVLEHLPDLPGELSFLASLLKPRGVMVFDVPAGSTRSHPMHLNHSLDVSGHLMAAGLHELRTALRGLRFKKQEKYVFRAPR